MTEQIKAVAKITQTESAYVPLSVEAGKACANCRFFDGGIGMCALIQNHPADILPTGYCNRWEAPPADNAAPKSEQAAEAAIEAVHEAIESAVQEATGQGMAEDKAHEHTDDETPTAPPAQPAGFMERVKSLFNRPDSSPFQVFKAVDGKHYWMARHTNIFEDRDKEILSSKAHAAYVARVALGLVDPPELWAYHTKGTRHGQADIVWEHAGFVFAIGHFDDTPEGQKAIKAYQKRKGKIELSHGFTYPRWALKSGVYDSYNTYEISTLPAGAASNPYTTFEEVNNMAMSEKQQNWIKESLGEEALKKALEAQGQAEKEGETLKALDKRYKDFAELETPTADDAKALDVAKTVGSVLGNLISAQAELAEMLETGKAEKAVADATVTAQAATLAAQATELKAIKEQLEAVKAQLDSRPRQGSKDSATTIDPATLPESVKNAMAETDKFWGLPAVPGQ